MTSATDDRDDAERPIRRDSAGAGGGGGQKGPPSGTGGSSTGDGSKESSAATSIVSLWQFLSATAVVAGLVAIVWIVVKNVSGDGDSAVGVLGMIVPAFATIGAAVFGITSVYQSAKATGEKVGEAKGEAGKSDAVDNARKRLASELLPDIDAARSRQSRLGTRLRTAGSSEPGRNILNFDQTMVEPLAIDPDELDETKAALERVHAKCEHILGG